MRLTARLALDQIKGNRNRSIMTFLGIVLSSAMLTAVCGYVESARVLFYNVMGRDIGAGNRAALLAVGTVLGSIIVTASVIVVSNAFRVSAGERTRQFGILKSVGATKRQIAASVLYEGVFISVSAIPVGIAAGLLIELLGTAIVTKLLHSMAGDDVLNVNAQEFLNVPFTVTPILFAVAILVSFATVLLSAWLPARKASIIPAIDAIRYAGEVKIKSKQLKTPRLVPSIFGFEAVLAAKSLKRSRRNSRATVVSLTINIVLLIVSGSFSELVESSTDLTFESIKATVAVNWFSDREMSYGEEGLVSRVDYISLKAATAEAITEQLRTFSNTPVYGIGAAQGYATKLPDGTESKASLVYVDSEHYKDLCEKAGVPVGSSLLLNQRREVVNGIKKEYKPYSFSEFEGKALTFALAGQESVEVVVTGELAGRDVPEEFGLLRYGNELTVVVPDAGTQSYTWYVYAKDPEAFLKYAEEVVDELTPQSTDKNEAYVSCMDIEGVTRQMKNLTNTIMFFVYGFVGMLTLIAVTSVISTIHTNVRARAREFAVLESVGMTKSDIRKMLHFESVFGSFRSLAYGIPIGVVAAVAMYQGMGYSVLLPFHFPWFPVLECVFGVFAVTGITMRYSANRIKGASVVETIRGE